MSFAALTPSLVRADALDEIQKRGKLIWGGDQEGGAPFVFPDPKDPNHLIGFEVDLAEMLANELGVTAQFQQGQWEKIPQMLAAKSTLPSTASNARHNGCAITFARAPITLLACS